MISDEIYGDKPRDAIRYEYHEISVQGLDLLSPNRNTDAEAAAEFKLHELNRTRVTGWELYCISTAPTFQLQDQPVTWPRLVFCKALRPGSHFVGPDLERKS